MGITRRVTGTKPKIDVLADAKRAAPIILDLIRARVAAGRDIFDRPFVAYDRDYQKTQSSSRVDLDGGAPGGLMSTLLVEVRRVGEDAVVVVRPSPAHAAVGAYLQNGTPHMRARPWLGLSPRDLVVLKQKLLR